MTMKNRILFSIVISLILFFQDTYSQDFVYLESNTFKYQGENFYPVVMNYRVNYRTDGTNYWAVPDHGYGSSNNIECSGKENCLETIKADMQLLQDLGFNAIRLVGVRPKYINENQLGFPAFTSNIVFQNKIYVPLQPDYSVHFELISDILDVVEEVGLKVILLNLGPIYDPIRENYINSLLEEFKNNSTLFAYDFINEPLYEDDITENKNQVCQIVSNWRDMMDAHAPNQLLTVGFTNSSEIWRWDPNILPIDFASFHPYGSSEIVLNEIYFYGEYINKPWIIGETGLAADDIIVTYEEQRDFAEKTLKRTVNCGGNGYSWWQYQDVSWGHYHQDYLGLLNKIGTTTTSDPSLIVKGTPKPAAQEFSIFETYTPTYNCERLSSFYNYSGYSDYKISGRLLNGNSNQPIEGGLIMGWDYFWGGKYYKTFTKSDGTFELFADINLNNLFATALGMNHSNKTVSFPVVVSNKTINIGTTETYATNNKINVLNTTIKGDGVSGGQINLYTPAVITLESGLTVEKGGILIAELENPTNIIDVGDIKVYPISSCYTSPKKTSVPSDEIANNLFKISDNSYGLSVLLYPNPSEGFINIVANADIDNLVIYNQNGQQIVNYYNLSEYFQLNLTEYPSGLYFIIVYSGNNIYRNKFILK